LHQKNFILPNIEITKTRHKKNLWPMCWSKGFKMRRGAFLHQLGLLLQYRTKNFSALHRIF